MSQVTERKDVRINLRATQATKNLLQRAADVANGGDLSAFVLAEAEERAKDLLRLQEIVELRADERERFYALLLDPPEPSEGLRRLFATSPSKKHRLVS